MTEKTQPTDAEIVAVMRDGYNCRYNDEQDHIDFARAVLAKWGSQPLRYDQSPTLFTVFAKCDEYEGEVPLAQYSATSEYGVLDRVMGDARNAGYTGHAKDRMTELGWRIVPVYAKPQPVVREPLTDAQIRAMAREYPAEDLCGWSYRMGIADTERHHGIKGGQHGTE